MHIIHKEDGIPSSPLSFLTPVMHNSLPNDAPLPCNTFLLETYTVVGHSISTKNTNSYMKMVVVTPSKQLDFKSIQACRKWCHRVTEPRPTPQLELHWCASPSRSNIVGLSLHGITLYLFFIFLDTSSHRRWWLRLLLLFFLSHSNLPLNLLYSRKEQAVEKKLEVGFGSSINERLGCL